MVSLCLVLQLYSHGPAACTYSASPFGAESGDGAAFCAFESTQMHRLLHGSPVEWSWHHVAAAAARGCTVLR
ncbi:hypothetical protein CLOP_g18556 [Closterium sp. NIES-67]|nr:hypothetical protein CLOP_g18556 [Closterium sp. NIES-67]